MSATRARHETEILDSVAALLFQHGVSKEELLDFVTEAIESCDEDTSSSSSLSETEKIALRQHGKDGLTMEKLIVRSLVETQPDTFSLHDRYTRVCYTVATATDSRRARDIWAIRAAGGSINEVKARVGMLFTSASEHGKGVDLFWLTGVDRRTRTISFTVAQIKSGKTPIHDGPDTEYTTNGNRSLQTIAKKLKAAAEAFSKAFTETWPNYKTEVTKLLISCSPLNQPAKDRAEANHIEVWDTQYLWVNVWMDDVKDCLRDEFGEKSHTLGV